MPSDEEITPSEGAPGVTPGPPRLVRLASFPDVRGTLVVADTGDSLPFSPVRYFVVRDVPPDALRAQHAQRHGHELLSCVAGACTVEVWWRGGNAVHRLDDPRAALYLPPQVWVECREFSGNAVLLVLCSHHYDPEDHITDFDEFRSGGKP